MRTSARTATTLASRLDSAIADEGSSRPSTMAPHRHEHRGHRHVSQRGRHPCGTTVIHQDRAAFACRDQRLALTQSEAMACAELDRSTFGPGREGNASQPPGVGGRADDGGMLPTLPLPAGTPADASTPIYLAKRGWFNHGLSDPHRLRHGVCHAAWGRP